MVKQHLILLCAHTAPALCVIIAIIFAALAALGEAEKIYTLETVDSHLKHQHVQYDGRANQKYDVQQIFVAVADNNPSSVAASAACAKYLQISIFEDASQVPIDSTAARISAASLRKMVLGTTRRTDTIAPTKTQKF